MKARPWKQYSAEEVQGLAWGPVVKTKALTYRFLRKGLPWEVKTVGQFVKFTRLDLLHIKGIGRVRIREIESSLADLGLELSAEQSPEHLRCGNCGCVVVAR